MIVRGYREKADGSGVTELRNIVDIDELTYTGKDMGERVINATLKYPEPIEFRRGDYIELQMATLNVDAEMRPKGGVSTERFYIYSMPTIKKIARPNASGDAFEHTIKFYPRQYELSHIVMRDLLQENSAAGMVYTGFGDFTFMGGAKTMAERIELVLNSYNEREGLELEPWKVYVSDMVNEKLNGSLEQYQYTMSDTSVMDALIMLTHEDNVHTTFYITGRNIYIGYTRPTVCRLDEYRLATNEPYVFKYGKTSHQLPNYGEGGLIDITKVVREQVPVTRLYAYGGNKNLNRFYCSDRLRPGRYVDRLMLPSFSEDGETDYIDSPKGIEKFGIHEGVKRFDDIYPSIRNITYGDLRKIRYVIKLMANGIDADPDESNVASDYNNSEHMPLVRVQCYRVEKVGPVNRLVEAWPDKDLAVFIHALSNSSKRVQCVLRSNERKQLHQDGKLPKRADGTVIPGACFAVHMGKIGGEDGYENLNPPQLTTSRAEWFADIYDESLPADKMHEIALQQVNYDDTARISDVFVFESFEQKRFSRDGYCPYCWARVNEDYPSSADALTRVDEIVRSTDVKMVDTYMTLDESNEQAEFEIYLRDVGFKINEQTPFGDMAHLINGSFNINFRDGMLGGLSFDVSAKNGSEKDQNVVPAYFMDGSQNPAFVSDADDPIIAAEALAAGAFWRIRCKRNDDLQEYKGEILPNAFVNAHAGDHIIFENIYMPLVYITAAENMLLREATKYLNNNDNLGVDYSVSMDKVRLQQLPALALQMREGVTMRIEDDDLQIITDNEEKVLHDGAGVGEYVDMMYTPRTMEVYVPTASKNSGKAVFAMDELHDNGASLYYLTGTAYIPKQSKTVSRLKIKFASQYRMPFRYNETPVNKPYKGYLNFIVTGQEDVEDTNMFFSSTASTTITKLSVTLEEKNLLHITEKDGYDVDTTALFGNRDSTQESFGFPFGVRQSHAESTDVTIIERHGVSETGGKLHDVYDKNALTEYKNDHYYRVTVDLPYERENTVCRDYTLCLYDGIGNGRSRYQPTILERVRLENGEDTPEGYRRWEYRFYLPTSFNDSANYYTGFAVVGDGVNEYASYRLVSIVESNMNAEGEYIHYVDLVLDQITVKLTSSSMTGWEDTNTKQEIFREINATVKEQQSASAWGSLMNQVEHNKILGEHNEQTLESFAVQSRRRFRNLQELRESIFDPDGTVTDVFLQTMMLQVGADSMCYSLDRTKIFNGTMRNIDFYEVVDEYYWKVTIGADVLRHYVYSYADGDEGSKWIVRGMQEGVLVDNLKRYFIAIKASKTTSDAEWIVTEEPLNVDAYASEGCWVFNYGIVLSGGTARVIMETRGNAYMYGDNVICGRITTMDGKSYFDLTGNELKIGDRLRYKDGELMIGGRNDGGTYHPGMVVTDVLELKDENKNVTAGMSGLQNDGLMIWGGGDYSEAKYAVSHGYNKQDGNPITTAIKQDGTGKIGVFRIDKDTVKVTVAGKDAVLITSKTMNDVFEDLSQRVETVAEVVRTRSSQDTYNIIPGSIISIPSAGYFDITQCQITGDVIVHNASGQYIPNSWVRISLALVSDTLSVISVLHESTHLTNDPIISYTLKRFRYKPIRDYECMLAVRVEIVSAEGYSDLSSFTSDIRLTARVVSSFSPDFDAKTIIASDGFVSAKNYNQYVKIKNDTENQEVIFKGLPTINEIGDVSSGGLYTTADGFVKIKY